MQGSMWEISDHEQLMQTAVLEEIIASRHML